METVLEEMTLHLGRIKIGKLIGELSSFCTQDEYDMDSSSVLRKLKVVSLSGVRSTRM